MKVFDPTRFRWPIPWRPLTDDAEALAFGRRHVTMTGRPAVADTVLGELRREICDRHPLAGVECRPVAWSSLGSKDFLFLTARPDMPVALVHFTWTVEREPAWPFVIPYRSLRHFVWRERKWIVEARALMRRLWRQVAGPW